MFSTLDEAEISRLIALAKKRAAAERLRKFYTGEKKMDVGMKIEGAPNGALTVTGNTVYNSKPSKRLYKVTIVEIDEDLRIVKILLEEQILAFNRDEALLRVATKITTPFVGLRASVQEVTI